jgi:hypothetical protein
MNVLQVHIMLLQVQLVSPSMALPKPQRCPLRKEQAPPVIGGALVAAAQPVAQVSVPSIVSAAPAWPLPPRGAGQVQFSDSPGSAAG